ncbi:MAG TPA: hypothetical protein VFZ78_03285 [Flavisolibacter sp.]
MKVWATILVLTISSAACAQAVDGFWKGSLTMPNGCFATNNIELQISTSVLGLRGDSYHYQDIDYYVKKNFSGRYNEGTKMLVIQESQVLTFNIRASCSVCIKEYVLEYSKKGNREYLTGYWTGFILGSRVSCDTGTITLERIRESAFKEIPEIHVDTGTLRLDFYDNAEIDGDSITVLVNHKPVVSHQRLGGKPITVYVAIDLTNTFVEVEMKAENLGTIPPNTSVLIVTTPYEQHRLFLSSTEEKSARVRFVYRPPDQIKSTTRTTEL